jgi:hypothetical protein
LGNLLAVQQQVELRHDFEVHNLGLTLVRRRDRGLDRLLLKSGPRND